MALRTNKKKDVPEGAVLVSKEEALKYQKNFIKDWPSSSEVFFLKYAPYVCGVANSVSSVFALKFLKRRMNVGKPFWKVALPTLAFVNFTTILTTDSVVTHSVLLMSTDCPMCTLLNFGIRQMYLGVIFPFSYAYFSAVTFISPVNREVLKDSKINIELLKNHCKRVFKGSSSLFAALGLFQTVVILFLPYIQQKQLSIVMEKAKPLEADDSEDLEQYKDFF